MGSSRMLAVAIPAAIALALLAGCVAQPVAKPTGSATPTATTSAAPVPAADPTHEPGGTAQANLPYFDLVNNKLFAANGSADGKTIIDNLVSAGFAKEDMQLTPDKTSIGVGADSVLFAVHIGDYCLLGQHGGGGYTSSIAKAISTGGPCLVGKTRAIDW
ncbi:MAG: hypothetical protein JWO10_488 [Microbacteriaceae bacterium]|nr:hypothetical protein [Microbacteriaceae bacterium]